MSTYRQELRPTLALAFPIVIGQVSQMLIGITDSAMIGRVGTVPLAATAFTHSVFSLFFVIGIGLLIPVSVFTARDHGAGNERGCAVWLHHGLALALITSGAAFVIMAILGTQLHRFGQPPEVVAIVRPFYLLIATSLIPTLFFQVQRQFAESLGRPWTPMAIMLADVALNAFLNWVLIYGHLGVPALGLTGAGIATLLARTAAVVALAIWLRRAETFAEVRAAPRGGWERARFTALLKMGVPAASGLLFEVGAFSAAALMMGWLGATPLAAHQIALSCAAFMFMFPLGLSTAVSMRISKAVGEKRRAALRPIGFGGLVMALAIMTSSAILFALAGRPLAAAFTSDPEVIALAARLLIVAAMFQLFDGAQVICAGALRGLTDVKIPTIITFVAYWVLALPGGYLFGVRGAFGALGIWTSLAAGLAFAAIFLALRFARLTRTDVIY